MIREQIIGFNDKLFDEQMRRESFIVKDANTHKEYEVIGKKNTTSKDEMILFHKQIKDNFEKGNDSLKNGKIVEYSGNHYLITAQERIESETYIKSNATRCNAEIYIVLKGFARKIVCVVEESTRADLIGNELNIIDSSIKIRTSHEDILNDAIDTNIFAFGGKYTVTNSFFVDGIHTFNLQQQMKSPNDNDIAVVYPGSLKVGTKVKLEVIRLAQDHLTWVKDLDTQLSTTNSEVAQIDSEGVLEVLGEGTFKIRYLNAKGTYDETSEIVIEGGSVPEPPKEIEWTLTDTVGSMQIGIKASFIAVPSEDTTELPEWKYFIDDEEYSEEDLMEYFTIEHDARYLRVTPTNKVMVKYKFKVALVVNGVIVAEGENHLITA